MLNKLDELLVMDVSKIPPGPDKKFPGIIHVVVEVPKGTKNKYEMDEKSGALILDRVLFTTNIYPGDYGFVPGTISEDGDPVDCLVFVTERNFAGAVIPVRPVALMRMEDERGSDNKIIAFPAPKVDPRFKGKNDLCDLSPQFKKEIAHFFSHMKELEPGKWVKVKGWANAKTAISYLEKCRKEYLKKHKA